MSEDRIWDAISELQKGQAAGNQGVSDLTKSVDKLTQTVERSIERSNERAGAQELRTIEIRKDVDSIGSKQRDHEESHRWWAGTIIAGAGAAVAFLEYMKGLFQGKSHG